MRNFVVILLLMLTSLSTSAQFSMYSESQIYTSKKQNYFFTSLYSTYMTGNNIGFWNYSQISKDGWGEIIVGPIIKAEIGHTNFELGVGSGLERFCLKIRASTFLLICTGKNTAYSDIEFLGSGSWYVAYYKREISEKISLGISVQSDATFGPRIDLALGNFNLWTVPGYYLKSKQAGIQFGLGIDLF